MEGPHRGNRPRRVGAVGPLSGPPHANPLRVERASRRTAGRKRRGTQRPSRSAPPDGKVNGRNGEGMQAVEGPQRGSRRTTWDTGPDTSAHTTRLVCGPSGRQRQEQKRRREEGPLIGRGQQVEVLRNVKHRESLPGPTATGPGAVPVHCTVGSRLHTRSTATRGVVGGTATPTAGDD